MSKRLSVKEKPQPHQLGFFFTVKSACDDVLILVKLEFFISVAKPLRQFLAKFQTEAPVAPFWEFYLKELLMAIPCRFLKKEVVKEADTFEMSKVDPADKKNQKHPKHVDLGFDAQDALKKVTEKNSAGELCI